MSSWKNMKPLNKGIILIILSAFFFALMMMFVRLAGDLPSVQKSFFRNFVAFFFAGAILIKQDVAVFCYCFQYFPFKRKNKAGTNAYCNRCVSGCYVCC